MLMAVVCARKWSDDLLSRRVRSVDELQRSENDSMADRRIGSFRLGFYRPELSRQSKVASLSP